jgi:hypothetical protein
MHEQTIQKREELSAASQDLSEQQDATAEALIIIETPHGKLPAFAMEALCAEIPRHQSVRILLFADVSLADLWRRLGKACPAYQIIDAAPMLDAEARDFVQTLPTWMEALAGSFAGLPDFWLSRFTELSLGTAVWFDLLRASVTQKVLAERPFGKCVLVGQEPFITTIADLLSATGIPSSSVPLGGKKDPGWTRILMRGVAIWGHNLASELTAWWLTRRKAEPGTGGLQIFTSFPNNWLHLESGQKPAILRYSGHLANSLNADQGDGGAYLCTLPRHARSRLKSPAEVHRAFQTAKSARPDMPIIWAEGFGGLSDIVAAYFGLRGWLRWFLTWRSLLKGAGIRWNGADIGFLFREAVIFGPLVDWPSNRLLERCLAKALLATTPRLVLVPGFEFAEGRTVTRTARAAAIESIGLQHGANSLPHLWRFSRILGVMRKEAERGRRSLPARILVEGQADAEHLRAVGFKSGASIVVGAPRITDEIPELEIRQPTKRNLLLLGDLPGARANEDPWWLDWCLSDLARDFAFTIRPHPTVARETAQVLQAIRQRTDFSAELGGTGTLAEEMERIQPLAVIGCITGSTIEVAMRGWPIAIFRSNWLPDLSPFSSLRDSEIFSTRDPDDLLVWLSRLENDPVYRVKYIRSSCRAAHLLVAATDTEAAALLASEVRERPSSVTSIQ